MLQILLDHFRNMMEHILGRCDCSGFQLIHYVIVNKIDVGIPDSRSALKLRSNLIDFTTPFSQKSKHRKRHFTTFGNYSFRMHPFFLLNPDLLILSVIAPQHMKLMAIHSNFSFLLIPIFLKKMMSYNIVTPNLSGDKFFPSYNHHALELSLAHTISLQCQ